MAKRVKKAAADKKIGKVRPLLVSELAVGLLRKSKDSGGPVEHVCPATNERVVVNVATEDVIVHCADGSVNKYPLGKKILSGRSSEEVLSHVLRVHNNEPPQFADE